MPKYRIETANGTYVVESPRELTDADLQGYIKQYNTPEKPPANVYYGSQDMKPREVHYGTQDMAPRSFKPIQPPTPGKQPQSKLPIDPVLAQRAAMGDMTAAAQIGQKQIQSAPKRKGPAAILPPVKADAQGRVKVGGTIKGLVPQAKDGLDEYARQGLAQETAQRSPDEKIAAMGRSSKPIAKAAASKAYTERDPKDLNEVWDLAKYQAKILWQRTPEIAKAAGEVLPQYSALATDLLGQKVLGEKPGWFEKDPDKSAATRRVVQNMQYFLPGFNMALLGATGASVAHTAVENPDQLMDVAKGLVQQVNPFEPGIDNVEAGLRTFNLIVAGIGAIHVKGKIERSVIKRKIMKEYGFTAEQAGQAMNMAEAYAAQGYPGNRDARAVMDFERFFQPRKKLNTARLAASDAYAKGIRGEVPSAGPTDFINADPRLVPTAGMVPPTEIPTASPKIPTPPAAPNAKSKVVVPEDLIAMSDKDLAGFGERWSEIAKPDQERILEELRTRGQGMGTNAPPQQHTQEEIDAMIDADKAAQAEAAKTPEQKLRDKADQQFNNGDLTGLRETLNEIEKLQSGGDQPPAPAVTPDSVTPVSGVHPNAQKIFDDAVAVMDVPKLKDILHLGNKQLRKQFEEHTSWSLPKTESGTSEFLDALGAVKTAVAMGHGMEEAQTELQRVISKHQLRRVGDPNGEDIGFNLGEDAATVPTETSVTAPKADETLYHGGASEYETLSPGTGVDGDGIYLTTDKNRATVYGKRDNQGVDREPHITEATIDPTKAKVWDDQATYDVVDVLGENEARAMYEKLISQGWLRHYKTGELIPFEDWRQQSGQTIRVQYIADRSNKKLLEMGYNVIKNNSDRIVLDGGILKYKQPTPTTPKPVEAPQNGWREIGKNSEGVTLYENEKGHRSTLENGFRHTEPIAIRPTRAGMESAIDRRDEYKTTEELAAESGSESPKPKSPKIPTPPPAKGKEFSLRSPGDEPKVGKATTREDVQAYAQGWKDVTRDHPDAERMLAEGFRLIESRFRTTDGRGQSIDEPTYSLVDPDRRVIYVGRNVPGNTFFEYDYYFAREFDSGEMELPNIESLVDSEIEAAADRKEQKAKSKPVIPGSSIKSKPIATASDLLEDFREQSADLDGEKWDSVANAIDQSSLPAKAKPALLNQIVASGLEDIGAIKRVIVAAEKEPNFVFASRDRGEKSGQFGLRKKGDRDYGDSSIQTLIDNEIAKSRATPDAERSDKAPAPSPAGETQFDIAEPDTWVGKTFRVDNGKLFRIDKTNYVKDGKQWALFTWLEGNQKDSATISNLRLGMTSNSIKLHAESAQPKSPPTAIAGSPAVSRFNQAKQHVDLAAKLSDAITTAIDEGAPIKWNDLAKMADASFGGSQTQGKYDARDMYDSLEVAVQDYIRKAHPDIMEMSVDDALSVLSRIEDVIPTQTLRTETQTKLQQFSTPPREAYLVVKSLGNIKGLAALEPSAGTGSIANFLRLAGAKVTTNEFPGPEGKLRADLLAHQGYEVLRNDAERLDAFLPDRKFDIVAMNPPFSATGGRVKNNKTKYGADHVESAARMLSPGGRLVAIVGNGMSDASAHNAWFGVMSKVFNYRANLLINGEEYKKHGTTFDNRILVFDKGGETGTVIRPSEKLTLAEAAKYLESLGNERSNIRPSAGTSGSGLDQQTKGAGDAIATGDSQPGSGPVIAGSPRTPIGGTGSKSGGRGSNLSNAGQSGPTSASGGNLEGRDTKPESVKGNDAEGTKGQRSGGDSDGAGSSGSLKVTKGEKKRQEPETDEIERFDSYQAPIAGPVHPTALVETGSMSGVQGPLERLSEAELSDLIKFPANIVKEERISSAQLETIMLAELANRQSHGGATGAILIGDGTGVGKGREIAGIITNNWYQGNRRIVWISADHKKLASQGQDDLANVAGDGVIPSETIAKYGATAPITLNEGVIFEGYDTLRNPDRIAQLDAWLKSVDAPVIIFDESHKAANAVQTGRGEASKRGGAVLELQKRFPKARITYATATAADRIDNIGYMTRLGLWGPGTSFETFKNFAEFIRRGGIGAQEMLAREMKAMGVYVSRFVAFKHPNGDPLTYREVAIDPTPEMLSMYDDAAAAWSKVLNLVQEFVSEGKLTKSEVDSFNSQYWSTHQRFFKSLTTAFKVPTMFKEIEQALANGFSPVIAIDSTNEASMNDKLAQAQSAGLDIDEIDFSNKEALRRLVERTFPTQLTQEVTDEGSDKTITVKVWKNKEGEVKLSQFSPGNEWSPVEDPRKVEMRNDLLEETEELNVPGNPLDEIILHFGPQSVAEISGRSKRLVRDPKTGQIKTEAITKPKGAPGKDATEWQLREFQSGKRDILVITRAGAQGISAHASRDVKNQKQRMHFILEPGWNTKDEVQKLGRTHRSGQVIGPEYVLMSVQIGGEKRFSSALASKLAALGAMQRGDRTSSGAGALAKYDFNSEYGQYAAHGAFASLTPEQEARMGLLNMEGHTKKLPDDTAELLAALFNRMLVLSVNEQNQLYDAFQRSFESAVNRAKASGKFEDTVEDIKANKIVEKSKQVIHTDERSRAQSVYHELVATVPVKRMSWDVAKGRANDPDFGGIGFYRNRKSDAVAMVVQDGQGADMSYTLARPSGKIDKNVDPYNFREHWGIIDQAEAETAWKETLDKLGNTTEETLHVISGLVLPVMDKLHGKSRVVRIPLDGGERLVGVLLDESNLRTSLRDLGVGYQAPKGSPEQLFNDAIDKMRPGEKIVLSGKIAIKKSYFQGSQGLEIVSEEGGHIPEGGPLESSLRTMGVIKFGKWGDVRLFVPTDPDRGLDVWLKLLKAHRPVDIPLSVSGESSNTSVNNSAGVSGMFTDPDGTIKANSGIGAQDILEALKNLDNPSYRISGPGTFSVQRKNPKTGYGVGNQFLQPLSIIDGEGNTIQVGTYERLGGGIGKRASETIRGAQQEIEKLTIDWENQLDKISDMMKGALDEINKANGVTASMRNRKNAIPEFIEIIESELDDPRRTGAKGALRKAINLHDKLTEYLRTYIIESRRELGIETPDDWGITEQGYYRHLFLGDIKILVDGKFIGTARTYAEAQKIAVDEHTKNPNAEIKAVGRTAQNMNEVLRVSTKRYFKVAKNIADSVEIPMSDIMDDLRGEIGMKSRRMKFFGALRQRTGAEGYSKDYLRVMRMHVAQVARTQELSKLNRALVPVIESMKAKGLKGLAEAVEIHLETLWGTTTRNERMIGDTIRNTPILRNYVANPDFALRGLALRLTKMQSFLKLSWNPRSSFVNLLQPYSTLWPYITTKEFAGLYTDLIKPSTRRMLKDKGVLEGDIKLEETMSGHRPKPTLFRAASGVNRGLGYLYGYRKGIESGQTEEQAHKSGLAWAEKVEFDNSAWNGAPIFRNPEAKVLGQFKGFMFKNIEHWADAIRERDGDTNFTRAGRISKLIGQQLVLGGLKSIIGIGKTVGFAILGYKLAEHLKYLLEQMGMSSENATRMAEAAYYGAPSLIGQDLTASVTLVDAPFGNDSREQLVNMAFGPTVSMGLNLQEKAEDYFTAQDKRKQGGTSKAAKQSKAIIAGAKALSPYVKMGEAAKKVYESKDGSIVIQSGEEKMTLNPFEAGMLVLGFTPLKQTRFYDRKDAGTPKGMPNPRTLIELAGRKK